MLFICYHGVTRLVVTFVCLLHFVEWSEALAAGRVVRSFLFPTFKQLRNTWFTQLRSCYTPSYNQYCPDASLDNLELSPMLLSFVR
jgi:hypothetical protein